MTKDDKFILMGINEAGDVAEVLKNKTCKKILDFLADNKETSEKDIADGIDSPINTVEYNLKKLIKAGFVKKSKNFFWSVKGKKIEVYKLAKKHIVISPNKKPNINALKTLLPIVLIIAITALILIGLYIPENSNNNNQNNTNVIISTSEARDLKTFQSLDELKTYLEENSEQETGYYGGVDDAVNMITKSSAPRAAVTESADSGGSGGSGTSDYSETNIQVKGVDEPDIIKNDGKYIYAVSNGKVYIIDAYPASDMKILTKLDINNSVSQIFINNNKLVVFSRSYEYVGYARDDEEIATDVAISGKSVVAPCYDGYCGGYSTSKTLVYTFDITDKTNPIISDKYAIEGDYRDSRMINDYVYVITNKYVNLKNPSPPMYWVNDREMAIDVASIYYPEYPSQNYIFSTIMAIDLNNGDYNSEVFLTGGSSDMYVSTNNIYLINEKYYNQYEFYDDMIKEVYLPIVPMNIQDKINEELAKDDDYWKKSQKIQKIITNYSVSLGREKTEFDKKLLNAIEDYNVNFAKKYHKTAIYKVNLDKLEINYETVGEVPGRVLNQFSMDEHNSYFRVATTTGNMWGGTSLNHLYILNKNLEIVGSVEDLAKGERIYSARFIGDRAYIVTFKKVDPLYVIDTSNPNNPKVLGYLKIPGYSDYLHPYDENHVIGIGKEAIEAEDSLKESRNIDFAWYQGIKISLFDVTNVEKPVEKDKYLIGDRGTNSPALHDHKAILFDKEKEIFVIPIQLHQIDKSKYDSDDEIPDTAYGDFVWQGAYVFNINLNGISYVGRVSHDEYNQLEKFRPAKDEPVGAKRTDSNGLIWTKISTEDSGYWQIIVNPPENYKGITWGDYMIDNLPRGINYNRYPDYQKQIQRSLYIDNVLYTMSQKRVLASDLFNLIEISSIDFPFDKENPKVFYDY